MTDLIRLHFSNKYYKAKFVRQAAAAFKDVARFQVRGAADGCSVTVDGFDSADREQIEGEFCNYVFHISKTAGMGSNG